MVLILAFVLSLLFLTSCTTRIPNSEEAKTRMEFRGYTTSLSHILGYEAELLHVRQVTVLTAQKEGEYLQVYFFANEEDTNTFYEENRKAILYDIPVVEKNRYSIYRGTENAVNDFLNETE